MVNGTDFFSGNPLVFNIADPLQLFVMQALVIIVFTRLLQYPLSFLREPRVIAEVVGGILLGPSALSRIPAFQQALFPSDSIPFLNLVANFGLVFFLFLVGLELDPRVMLRNARRTFVIGLAGMTVPFVISIGVAYALYGIRSSDAGDYSFGTFYLFIAVALSITAFPVLARILTELNLLRTPVGLLSISAAAVDDVAAWILLALVISLVHAQNALKSLWIFLILIAYVVFVVFAIRPAYVWLMRRERRLAESGPSAFIVMITFVLVLASAFFTSALGVHAIFGGFIIGLIVPHEGGFAVKLAEKVEDFVSILFLPLYFALSGLKTQIGLLNDGLSWGFVVLITVCAVAGKAFGCTAASKFQGLPWRESFTIGVLMSCKGLVELIVLNIGLDAKVLDARIFSMMVLMAIISTAITSPVVMWIYPQKLHRSLAVMQSTHPSVISLASSIRSDRRSSFVDGVSSAALLQTTPSEDAEPKQHMLVAVDQISHIPTVMQLLTVMTPPQRSAVRIHAVRLMELTMRMSSVMRYSEADESVRVDPLANVLRTFARVYNLSLDCSLVVTSPEDFSSAVATQSAEISADLTVVPWTPAVNEDGKYLRSLAEEIESNSHQSEYIRGIFCDVHGPVAVVLDRGIGTVVHTADMIEDNAVSEKPASPNTMTGTYRVLFVGGEDDRVALQLARVIQIHGHKVLVVRALDTTAGAAQANAEDESALAECGMRIENAASVKDMVLRVQDLTSSDVVILGRGETDHGTVLGNVAKQLADANFKSSMMVVRASKPSIHAPYRKGSVMEP